MVAIFDFWRPSWIDMVTIICTNFVTFITKWTIDAPIICTNIHRVQIWYPCCSKAYLINNRCQIDYKCCQIRPMWQFQDHLIRRPTVRLAWNWLRYLLWSPTFVCVSVCRNMITCYICVTYHTLRYHNLLSHFVITHYVITHCYQTVRYRLVLCEVGMPELTLELVQGRP